MPAVVATAKVVFQLTAKHFRDLSIFLESALAAVSVTGSERLGGDVLGNLGEEISVGARGFYLVSSYHKSMGYPEWIPRASIEAGDIKLPCRKVVDRTWKTCTHTPKVSISFLLSAATQPSISSTDHIGTTLRDQPGSEWNLGFLVPGRQAESGN